MERSEHDLNSATMNGSADNIAQNEENWDLPNQDSNTDAAGGISKFLSTDCYLMGSERVVRLLKRLRWVYCQSPPEEDGSYMDDDSSSSSSELEVEVTIDDETMAGTHGQNDASNVCPRRRRPPPILRLYSISRVLPASVTLTVRSARSMERTRAECLNGQEDSSEVEYPVGCFDDSLPQLQMATRSYTRGRLFTFDEVRAARIPQSSSRSGSRSMASASDSDEACIYRNNNISTNTFQRYGGCAPPRGERGSYDIFWMGRSVPPASSKNGVKSRRTKQSYTSRDVDSPTKVMVSLVHALLCSLPGLHAEIAPFPIPPSSLGYASPNVFAIIRRVAQLLMSSSSADLRLLERRTIGCGKATVAEGSDECGGGNGGSSSGEGRPNTAQGDTEDAPLEESDPSSLVYRFAIQEILAVGNAEFLHNVLPPIISFPAFAEESSDTFVSKSLLSSLLCGEQSGEESETDMPSPSCVISSSIRYMLEKGLGFPFPSVSGVDSGTNARFDSEVSQSHCREWAVRVLSVIACARTPVPSNVSSQPQAHDEKRVSVPSLPFEARLGALLSRLALSTRDANTKMRANFLEKKRIEGQVPCEDVGVTSSQGSSTKEATVPNPSVSVPAAPSLAEAPASDISRANSSTRCGGVVTATVLRPRTSSILGGPGSNPQTHDKKVNGMGALGEGGTDSPCLSLTTTPDGTAPNIASLAQAMGRIASKLLVSIPTIAKILRFALFVRIKLLIADYAMAVVEEGVRQQEIASARELGDIIRSIHHGLHAGLKSETHKDRAPEDGSGGNGFTVHLVGTSKSKSLLVMRRSTAGGAQTIGGPADGASACHEGYHGLFLPQCRALVSALSSPMRTHLFLMRCWLHIAFLGDKDGFVRDSLVLPLLAMAASDHSPFATASPPPDALPHALSHDLLKKYVAFVRGGGRETTHVHEVNAGKSEAGFNSHPSSSTRLITSVGGTTKPSFRGSQALDALADRIQRGQLEASANVEEGSDEPSVALLMSAFADGLGRSFESLTSASSSSGNEPYRHQSRGTLGGASVGGSSFLNPSPPPLTSETRFALCECLVLAAVAVLRRHIDRRNKEGQREGEALKGVEISVGHALVSSALGLAEEAAESPIGSTAARAASLLPMLLLAKSEMISFGGQIDDNSSIATASSTRGENSTPVEFIRRAVSISEDIKRFVGAGVFSKLGMGCPPEAVVLPTMPFVSHLFFLTYLPTLHCQDAITGIVEYLPPTNGSDTSSTRRRGQPRERPFHAQQTASSASSSSSSAGGEWGSAQKAPADQFLPLGFTRLDSKVNAPAKRLSRRERATAASVACSAALSDALAVAGFAPSVIIGTADKVSPLANTTNTSNSAVRVRSVDRVHSAWSNPQSEGKGPGSKDNSTGQLDDPQTDSVCVASGFLSYESHIIKRASLALQSSNVQHKATRHSASTRVDAQAPPVPTPPFAFARSAAAVVASEIFTSSVLDPLLLSTRSVRDDPNASRVSDGASDGDSTDAKTLSALGALIAKSFYRRWGELGPRLCSYKGFYPQPQQARVQKTANDLGTNSEESALFSFIDEVYGIHRDHRVAFNSSNIIFPDSQLGKPLFLVRDTTSDDAANQTNFPSGARTSVYSPHALGLIVESPATNALITNVLPPSLGADGVKALDGVSYLASLFGYDLGFENPTRTVEEAARNDHVTSRSAAVSGGKGNLTLPLLAALAPTSLLVFLLKPLALALAQQTSAHSTRSDVIDGCAVENRKDFLGLVQSFEKARGLAKHEHGGVFIVPHLSAASLMPRRCHSSFWLSLAASRASLGLCTKNEEGHDRVANTLRPASDGLTQHRDGVLAARVAYIVVALSALTALVERDAVLFAKRALIAAEIISRLKKAIPESSNMRALQAHALLRDTLLTTWPLVMLERCAVGTLDDSFLSTLYGDSTPIRSYCWEALVCGKNVEAPIANLLLKSSSSSPEARRAMHLCLLATLVDGLAVACSSLVHVAPARSEEGVQTHASWLSRCLLPTPLQLLCGQLSIDATRAASRLQTVYECALKSLARIASSEKAALSRVRASSSSARRSSNDNKNIKNANTEPTLAIFSTISRSRGVSGSAEFLSSNVEHTRRPQTAASARSPLKDATQAPHLCSQCALRRSSSAANRDKPQFQRASTASGSRPSLTGGVGSGTCSVCRAFVRVTASRSSSSTGGSFSTASSARAIITKVQGPSGGSTHMVGARVVGTANSARLPTRGPSSYSSKSDQPARHPCVRPFVNSKASKLTDSLNTSVPTLGAVNDVSHLPNCSSINCSFNEEDTSGSKNAPSSFRPLSASLTAGVQRATSRSIRMGVEGAGVEREEYCDEGEEVHSVDLGGFAQRKGSFRRQLLSAITSVRGGIGPESDLLGIPKLVSSEASSTRTETPERITPAPPIIARGCPQPSRPPSSASFANSSESSSIAPLSRGSSFVGVGGGLAATAGPLRMSVQDQVPTNHTRGSGRDTPSSPTPGAHGAHFFDHRSSQTPIEGRCDSYTLGVPGSSQIRVGRGTPTPPPPRELVRKIGFGTTYFVAKPKAE